MSGESKQAELPLILFSAMGADASIFLPQKLAFQNLIVPEWPKPVEDDNLASYCSRLAAATDPGCPCIVGGASFGGVVALEMTRHLDALPACKLAAYEVIINSLPISRLVDFSAVFGLHSEFSGWLVHVALNCSVCGVEKTEFKAATNR